MNNRFYDTCMALGAWEIYRPYSTHVQPLVGNATTTGTYTGGAAIRAPHTASGEPVLGGQSPDGGLDGSGDYVSLGITNYGAAWTAGTGITMCCSKVALDTNSDRATPGGLGGATAGQTGFRGLVAAGGSGTFKFQVWDKAATAKKVHQISQGVSGWNDGNVHTFIFSSDLVLASASKTAQFVYDGVDQPSFTENTDLLSGDYDTSGDNYDLGRAGGADNQYATGFLGHIAFWNKVLAISEMQELHRAMMGQARITRLSAIARPMGMRKVPRFVS